MKNPNVSSCIVAGYYKMDGRNNQYVADNKVKKIIGMYDTDNKKYRPQGTIAQAWSVGEIFRIII